MVVDDDYLADVRKIDHHISNLKLFRRTLQQVLKNSLIINVNKL